MSKHAPYRWGVHSCGQRKTGEPSRKHQKRRVNNTPYRNGLGGCECMFVYVFFFFLFVRVGNVRNRSRSKNSTCVRSFMTGAVSAARHGGVKRDECCCLFVGRARAHAVVLCYKVVSTRMCESYVCSLSSGPRLLVR